MFFRYGNVTRDQYSKLWWWYDGGGEILCRRGWGQRLKNKYDDGDDDDGDDVASATVTIHVDDVNDHTPHFVRSLYRTTM